MSPALIGVKWAKKLRQDASIPNISLTASISSEDKLLYAIHSMTNNTDTKVCFLHWLNDSMKITDSRLQANYVLLLDNASYHKTRKVRLCFKHIGIRVIYTAPHSFDYAPVERLFMYLKRVDLENGANLQAK